MSPVRSALLALSLTLVLTAAEPFRPTLHFSPAKNWTNDPCGLVFDHGLYHLFFQFNPEGDQWGHMSWGHATSPNLIDWTEQPVALREENGVMIFTGSSVFDEHNTSGLCQGPSCLIAIYSGHVVPSPTIKPLQHQNLAVSRDHGKTWTKYERNPVLNEGLANFRDPKVFWHAPSSQWIMAVSVPLEHKVRFYGSPNLKNWKQLGEFGNQGATNGDWECPELFSLPVDNEPGQSRWVLKIGLNPGGLYGGSGEQYFVGNFDGKTFTNSNPASLTLWSDYGRDCYCALTFNNQPTGHPLTLIGWMNNWEYASKLPTSPWRGQMTLPREVRLHRFSDGIRLTQRPVAELDARQQRLASVSSKSFDDAARQLRATTLPFPASLSAKLQLGAATHAGLRIKTADNEETVITYDTAQQRISVDRRRSGQVGFHPKFAGITSAPLPKPADGLLDLRIVLDGNSLELFAGGGRAVLTNLIFPSNRSAHVEPFAQGGAPSGITVDIDTFRSTRK